MVPYLKYFIVNNPTYGDTSPIEVLPPSEEEHMVLFGYEPTKINPDYNEFCFNYIKRTIKSIEQRRSAKLIIEKVAIDPKISNQIISEVEKRSDFVRWII